MKQKNELDNLFKQIKKVYKKEKKASVIYNRRLKKENKQVEKYIIEKWKLDVIENANWICEKCNKKLINRKQCHPHHIISEKAVKHTYPELLNNINNGILLCYYCHKASPHSAHQGGFEFFLFLEKKFPEKVAYLKKFLESSNY